MYRGKAMFHHCSKLDVVIGQIHESHKLVSRSFVFLSFRSLGIGTAARAHFFRSYLPFRRAIPTWHLSPFNREEHCFLTNSPHMTQQRGDRNSIGSVRSVGGRDKI